MSGIALPDRDYSCGAAFCDDPACNTHGPKSPDEELLYWVKRDYVDEELCEVSRDMLHCNCWYGGLWCCLCKAPAMTEEQKRKQGMAE